MCLCVCFIFINGLLLRRCVAFVVVSDRLAGVSQEGDGGLGRDQVWSVLAGRVR